MELDEQKKSWVLRSLEIEIRKQHRSITKLAQEMGAKPSWLYRILRGERGMDLFDFLKLTEVLGVSPREILKDYPPPPVVPGQELSADKLADLLSQIIPEEVLTILVNMKKPQN